MNALKRFLKLNPGVKVPEMADVVDDIHRLVNAHGAGKSVDKALGDLYTRNALEKFGEASQHKPGGLITPTGKDIALGGRYHEEIALDSIPEFIRKNYPVKYDELAEFLKRSGTIRYPAGRPEYGLQIHKMPTRNQMQFLKDYMAKHNQYGQIPVDAYTKWPDERTFGGIDIDDDFGENLLKFLRKAGL